MSLDPAQLAAALGHELGSVLTAMIWAEEEIEAAIRRHPSRAERLHECFILLTPTHPLMHTEAVFRAHCKELLDRVARDDDTRPGTAAECCVALCETSQRAPLRTAAVGLYIRMWRLAGLPPVDLTDPSDHYEAIAGTPIDDHEDWLRRTLQQPWRTLPASQTPHRPG